MGWVRSFLRRTGQQSLAGAWRGPVPVELEQLPDTFALAAEVDAVSPTFPQVLFVKVRRGTRSSVEARSYLTERQLPVMASEIHLQRNRNARYAGSGVSRCSPGRGR
jgi:hypothetical protein